ncbi:pilus assembly protein N-terminal domain-containing protein [Taklimakanibacter albus]|uniref:Pilus assembly protein N-terminal domain-containing protein n=1 Tax=Taklimakanibacter albus TaxID=2800327 RepID=A0ACC5RG44_9HYPH|nr:pilus assembly protein N-terminal domain-containing protein [Aestuariivirga sp. YIM B02566]MBK1871435.1 pilus assembly protein N-terminal domain-containing protein [Aestuariivirga sp. YIM B02566]
MIKLSLTSFACAAILTALTAPALAASDVVINADQAKIISVSGQPGMVVVGNPNIADVTVRGDQVVLMGRNYGVTNLIILDREGNQLAALDVTVQITDKNAVHVFKAGGRMSLACAPTCEQTLQVGDDVVRVFDPLSKEIQTKADLANGSSKAE